MMRSSTKRIADQGVAGGSYSPTPLTEISVDELREGMKVNFESNFCKPADRSVSPGAARNTLLTGRSRLP